MDQIVWAIVCGIVTCLLVFSCYSWFAFWLVHLVLTRVITSHYRMTVKYSKVKEIEAAAAGEELNNRLLFYQSVIKKPSGLLWLISVLAYLSIFVLWRLDYFSSVVEWAVCVSCWGAILVCFSVLLFRTSVAIKKLDRAKTQYDEDPRACEVTVSNALQADTGYVQRYLRSINR